MKPNKVIPISCIGVTLLAIVLIALPASNALADATPANNPSLGSNVLGIGTEAWVDPRNITSAGSPYATITLYMDHQVDHTYSNYLEGTSYGFQVPSDATITGIEVKINRMANLKNPSVVDNQVSLVKGGTIVGENKAMTTT